MKLKLLLLLSLSSFASFAQNYLKVTSLGESVLAQNSSVEISWASQGISSLKIEYANNFNSSFDTPNNWIEIEDNISASLGSVFWTVPEGMFSARVRVSSLDNPNLYDINDVNLSSYNEVTNPQSLEITRPIGGEVISTENDFYTVGIKASGITSNVEFDYSLDNGISWVVIDEYYYNDTPIETLVAFAKTFNWKLPSVNASNCRMRVRKLGSDKVLYQTNNFEITTNSSPVLRLTSPNDGGTFEGNSAVNISWLHNGIDMVKLEYASNYNFFSSVGQTTNWITIADNISSEDGNYLWKIPVDISTGRVRISDANNSTTSDVIDIDISSYDGVLNPTSFDFITPGGGETIRGESVFTLTWGNSNIQSEIIIELSTNNGQTWAETDFINENVFTYIRGAEWIVPNVSSNQCKLRAKLKGSDVVIGEESEVFSIGSSFGNVTLKSFDIYQSVNTNETFNIEWESINVDNVKIEYKNYFGFGAIESEWFVIASSVSGSQGFYSWTPSSDLVFGRVRISSVNGPSIYDLANADIISYDPIANPKMLELTSPIGDEELAGNSNYFDITFVQQNLNGNEITFEYSTDDGQNWENIDEFHFNGVKTNIAYGHSRSIRWRIPAVNSTQCKVRVKYEGSILDESEVFTIAGDLNGIGDKIKKTVSNIYPNPTKGQVLIESKEIIRNVHIYDPQGIFLFSVSEVNAINYDLNIADLNSGVYLITVETDFSFDSKQIVKID